jgi:polysaccharide chain length determinant protein (PEP-CTERM system associated)
LLFDQKDEGREIVSMFELFAQLPFDLVAVWRRRWHALAVAWLVCAVGWIFVASMPNSYESSARIYVDTQSMLGPLLKGLAVESDLEEELHVMERTLLSRPNLEQVARMTDLDVTARGPAQMESLLEALVRRISIRSEGGQLFSVNYTDTVPELAKEVVQSLLTIFVESNLGASREDMEGARRFIDRQIAEYEGSLVAAEERLAQFKQNNLGLLPGDKGFYEPLRDARRNLETSKTQLDETMTKRDALRRQLTSVPEFVETVSNSASPWQSQGPVAPPSEYDSRITKLEASIEDMLVRYTQDHPDVVIARRRLEQLRKQAEEEEADVVESPPGGGKDEESANLQLIKETAPNPLYEQVKLQLVEAEAEIARLQSRVARDQARLAEFEETAKRVPAVEAELTQLNRDYVINRQNYDALLARRESAKISQEREDEAEKVQFRIVDPPFVPILPSGPNRYLFLSAVLIIGIGAGLGFALALATQDDSFSDARHLESAFSLTILASVPEEISGARRGLRALETSSFTGVSLGLFVAYGGLMAIEQAFGLRNAVPPELMSWLSETLAAM